MFILLQTDRLVLVLVEETALLEETGPQESLVGSLDRQGSVLLGSLLGHRSYCLAILSSAQVQNGGNFLQFLPVSLAFLDDAVDLLDLPVGGALLQLVHLFRSRHAHFLLLHGGRSNWPFRSLDFDAWWDGTAIVVGSVLLDLLDVSVREGPPDLAGECVVVLVLTHGDLLHLSGGGST